MSPLRSASHFNKGVAAAVEILNGVADESWARDLIDVNQFSDSQSADLEIVTNDRKP
jgi:hypothetical protein